MNIFRFFFFFNKFIQYYKFPSKHCFLCTAQIMVKSWFKFHLAQNVFKFLLEISSLTHVLFGRVRRFVFVFVFVFLSFVVFFRAIPTAYGGSQVRGLIGATAAGLYHSHSYVGSHEYLQPTPHLRAMLDP